MAEKKPSGDGFEVGYGKPPKSTQFKKGVSGNPSGRPKKPRDLSSMLLEEANSLITINENGRRTRVPRNRVIAKQLVNNAMKGKPSDLRLYFAIYPEVAQIAEARLAQRANDLQKADDPRNLSEDQLMQIVLASLPKDNTK